MKQQKQFVSLTLIQGMLSTIQNIQLGDTTEAIREPDFA